MGRPVKRAWALLACGVCLLAVLSAVAAAAPARRAVKHRSATAHRCRTRARKRVRTRRAARCPAVKHSSKATHPTTPPPSAAAPAGTPVLTPTTPGGAGSPVSESTTTPTEAPGTKAPPAIPHVQVTAVEYHYTLSRTSVPAGKVILQFVNDGEDEHNLNVLPAEGPPAGTFSNLASRGITTQEIELRPGSYTLFCSLPEHEKKGMKATLSVE